jgi:hypothetical protein
MPANCCLCPHIKKNLEKGLEQNPKTVYIMQEHYSNSVESLTYRIHGFPHIFHSIFRTHPGQGIYTDFNNNNDNLD